jgi:hypothetical protein
MPAPIKHTCPDIDKYIKSIKWVMVKERDLKNMNESDLYDAAVSMTQELGDCIDYLEDLRKSNGALRDWGESLENELKEANMEIDVLENKIEDLNNSGVKIDV